MKRLTKKQARIARERVKDPEASQREIGDRVGMTQPHVARELAKPHVQARVAELMERRPKLQDSALFKKLEEGLDATETKFFQKDGHVLEEKVCVDYPTREKYLGLAFELKGHRRPQGSSDQPVHAVLIGIFSAIEQARAAGVIPAEATT